MFLSPTKQKIGGTRFSPRPARSACKSTWVGVSAEAIFQDRASRLWDDDDDDAHIKLSPNGPRSWILESQYGSRSDAALRLLLSTQGLPFHIRARAWGRWSGAEDLRGLFPLDHYRRLRDRFTAHSDGSSPIRDSYFEDHLAVIGCDLKRTCQDHSYFTNADGLVSLEHILTATLIHRPDVGYTQGMNYLGAFILLTFQLAGENDTDIESSMGSGYYCTPAV